MSNGIQNISALMPDGVGAFLFESVGSTNDEARTLFQQGQPLPLWVTAKAQNQGRGRRGRIWTGMDGNLFASLVTAMPKAVAGLPFVAALSVRAALIEAGLSDDCVACKWPNDVLINGAKVAGILIEAEAPLTAGGQGTVIVGTGVNLAASPTDTPYPATSVFDHLGKAIDPILFLAYQASAFKRLLAVLDGGGLRSICDEWLSVAAGVGDDVEARMADETIRGTFKGIADDGAFLLGVDGRMDAANERKLYVADIFPLTHKTI